MSSCRLIASVAVIVVLCLFFSVSVLAIPSNREVVRVLEQPDGSTFEARLFGDEWVHWYETQEGYTVVRASDRFWYYAELDRDGRLVPSNVAVGAGSPYGEQHLRPNPSVLSDYYLSRRASLRGTMATAGITGVHQAVIILIEFNDTPGGEGSTGPHDDLYFAASDTGLVLGGNQGRMADYYDEVSYSLLDLQGVVANGIWHLSAQPELYYGEDCDPGQPCNPDYGPPLGVDNCNVCIYELAREAVRKADTAGFDFSPYDTDFDGVVDHVIIVHAGHNQASFGGGADDVWSHYWAIPGGEPVDGVSVEYYMMLSEHDAMSVFAHEFAHDLGAPDLYDYDDDSDPVGLWCNMGYNFENNRPPHLCGLLKIDIDADFSNGMMGWITPGLLDADSLYTVARLDENSTGSVLVTDPAFSGGEYYIVENRHESGFYDYSVPESGIIITHYDNGMPDGSGRFNDGPPNNSYHGAWIERPLNLAAPNGAAYSSDDGEVELSPTSLPNTNANGGVGTGLKFQNIGAESDVMSFEFRPGPTAVSGSTSGNTTWDLDDSPVLVTGYFTVSDGDTLTIEAGVVVKFNSSARMVVNGALIAQGTPADTIVFTSYRDDEFGGDTNGDGPSTGGRGDWHHIIFENADAGCLMSYCRVRCAGQPLYLNYIRYGNAIVLSGSGTALTMTNCIVERTDIYSTSMSYNPFAIYAHSGTSLDISESVIRYCDYYGIYSEGSLTLVNSAIYNVGYTGVFCTSSGATFTNNLIENNGGDGIYCTGSSCIVTNNRIIGNTRNALYLTGSSCQVVADTLESNGGMGLYCPNLPAGFYDNISTGNGDWGYYVPADVVDDVWLNNVMNSNGRDNAIAVTAGSINTFTQWRDEHLYAVFGEIAVNDGVTFALEPGVILKFNTYTRLVVDGTLIAEGTETDGMTFTSYKDDEYGGDTNGDGPSSGSRGDWLHILFENADAGCLMSYCRVRYSGQAAYINYISYGNAIVLSGSGTALTMTNCIVEYTDMYSTSYKPYAIYGHSGTSLDISESVIRYCDYYGIYCQGSLTLVNSTVSNAGYTGVYSSSSGAVVTNSVFSDNGNHGLDLTGSSCHVVADTVLSNAGDGLRVSQMPAEFYDNYGADNAKCELVVPVQIVDETWLTNEVQLGDEVGIFGGSLTESVQWIDEHPFAVYGGNITIPHDITLTLEPGVIIKFDQYHGLIVNGALVAEGTSSDWITFTSYKDDSYGGDTNGNGISSGSPGDWLHLKFDNTNTGCSMRYCRVRFAGRYHGTYNDYHCNAVIANGAGAELTMTNCLIERTGGGYSYPYAVAAFTGSDFQISHCEAYNNNGVGIYVSEPTALIDGCNAIDNTGYGFYVRPELVGEVAVDDTLTNNGYGNCLAMISGTITADDSWPKTYTYLVNGPVTIDPGATLTIHKGSVVKFNGNQKLEVQGGLYAQGDAVEKIVFTSYKDDNYGGDTNQNGVNNLPAPGDWGQIHFNGATTGSILGWAVVSYGGNSSVPAIQLDTCDLSFLECIIYENLDRSVLVGSDATFTINNSDMYDNPGGLVNLNTGVNTDARNCWWGDASGPSGVGPGPSTADPVSSYVLYDPWLERSIDNPWIAFTSPAPSGNYLDVLIFDLNEDDLMDLIAATEESGLEVFIRTGFEEWLEVSSPITSGQYFTLEKGDINNDGHDDLLVCGSDGIRCFTGDGAGNLTETGSILVGPSCKDVKFKHVNHDAHLDIIGGSGDNGGIWVFYGNGLGNWNAGIRPTITNSFNKIDGQDLNNDTYIDIVATSAEYYGVNIWYGAADSTWTATTPIEDGSAFYGLALGDLEPDGDYDIAVGSTETNIGIKIYLNDGYGVFTELAGPVTTGRYKDIILADLNLDGRLDLLGANHFGGINVWVGTSSLFWNFWYHPASSNIYNGICVDDFTLNNSLDLAGASSIYGIALWDNMTTGGPQEIFDTNPDNISFGLVATGNCAHEEFQLENVSADSVFNIVVYTTNPTFDVSYSMGGGDPSSVPFDMGPGDIIDFEVSFCPTEESVESEIVIIHSSISVTHLRVSGEGVPFINPVWTVDLLVENAVGGVDNSDSLTFGGGIGATDSLDIEAGEVGLPPLPPTEVFDTRFHVLGCEGSLVNIHDYYRETDSFVFQWQTGSGGDPVTVSWDPNALPDGTFLISDVMGGVFQDTLNMADTSYIVVSAPVTQLVVTTLRMSTFQYTLYEGWSLRSRAVTIEEDSLSQLFPGAVSAFTWADGYVQVHELGIGSGYWVNMGMDNTASHVGEQVRTVHRALPAGWSLIGTVYDTVLVDDMQQNPSGCVQSIFGFDGAYYLADDVLLPGQGYWVDLNQAGEITITSGTGSGGSGGSRLIADIPEHKRTFDQLGGATPSMSNWRLPVTIQNVSRVSSESQTVVVGFDARATNGVDIGLGERCVPPWPPSSVLESRLALKEQNGLYLDLRKSGSDVQNFELIWQAGSGGYPVVVSWDPDAIPAGAILTLSDNLDGSFIGPIDMREASSVVINAEESFIRGLKITAQAEDGDSPPSITRFTLMQNVPNPFNPSTMICYDLPKQVHVRLQVFDVAGRVVRTLVDRTVPAGRHTVEWNGRNNEGNAVASGVYFYRINTPGWKQTRKLVLLR